MKLSVIIVLGIFMLLTLPSEAGNFPPPQVKNIGFMETPPKELREKFPMCEEFLKVEWIDKTKRIGYSHYEWETDQGKDEVWALVNLYDQMPSFTLDISQYKHDNKMNELFKLVKTGKPQRGIDDDLFSINGERFYEDYVHYDPPLLNDSQETICIVYPNGQRAWIIEGKSVEHTYSETQIANLVETINKLKLPDYTPEYAARIKRDMYSKFTSEAFEPLWVLDINHDGKADFLRVRYPAEMVVYSFGDQYFRNAVKEHHVEKGITWAFPPRMGICAIKPRERAAFLTTDGHDYYLNNQCNLTELTSPGRPLH